MKWFLAPLFLTVFPNFPLWGGEEKTPAWADAYKQGPMTAAETRAFMKALARFVFDWHLRKDDSPMRGMIYEYHDVTRKGQYDQFVQGEALDTMHDGAWFAAAMVNAYRATGDPFYKEILTKWQLPFYCKMLNHSDSLFRPTRNDAREKAHKFDKEHALQVGEKGFVPYFWDDGGSVSLERRHDKNLLGTFACTDNLTGKENSKYLLNGYSHGSSNHLAQDLAVMLQLSWLLLHESKDESDRKLAGEVALAAKNLQECRMRHHGHIPMVDAAAALANNDTALMKHVPDQSGPANWNPDNHYFRALYNFKPGQRYAFPGFADDQQYHYYTGLAKHGGKIPRPLAFRAIYDAFTEPMLYRYYSDDAPVPPGINRFDLHPYYCKDGRPEDYRSDRKGPGGKPRPIGSRMGPQNMICCGWGLQLLKEYPGIWEERYGRDFGKDLWLKTSEDWKEKISKSKTRWTYGVEHGRYLEEENKPILYFMSEEVTVKTWLEKELGGGLRTWEAIFKERGYIPTGIDAGWLWDRFSDSGGYAHLISAASQWLLYLEGKKDWEVHGVTGGGRKRER